MSVAQQILGVYHIPLTVWLDPPLGLDIPPANPYWDICPYSKWVGLSSRHFSWTDLVGDLRVLMLSPCAQVGNAFPICFASLECDRWAMGRGWVFQTPWQEGGRVGSANLFFDVSMVRKISTDQWNAFTPTFGRMSASCRSNFQVSSSFFNLN